MVSDTSARPSGGRPDVPAKMTSSIFPPRNDFAPCSPNTHAMASTTFDLPEPFGPTTAVMPGSKRKVVADAKDLKPLRVRLFRCTRGTPVPGHAQGGTHGACRAGKAGATLTRRTASHPPTRPGAGRFVDSAACRGHADG